MFILVNIKIRKATEYIVKCEVLTVNAHVKISPFRGIYNSFRAKHFLGVVATDLKLDFPDANSSSIR